MSLQMQVPENIFGKCVVTQIRQVCTYMSLKKFKKRKTVLFRWQLVIDDCVICHTCILFFIT